MSTDQREVELSIEVSLVEDETAVYVRIHGFENLEDADVYADFLANNLPLMLFNSEVKH